MRSDAGTMQPLDELLQRNPSSVWARPGLTLLGWGARHEIDPGVGADRFDSALRQLRAAGSPIALAGFSFDEDRPGSILTVPEVLARIDENGVDFILGTREELPDVSPARLVPGGRISPVDRDGWKTGAAEALRAIARSEMEKVVLSRTMEVEFEDDIPTLPLLESLLETEPASHTYLIEGLIGSSPELLVSLRSGVVRSLSLAGSAPAEKAEALSTEKMTMEHMLAADSVEDALAPHCGHVDRSKSTIATFGKIQHLATRFEGTAHPGTVVTDILATLHPTAAVAGTPTKSAVELIREIEHHDRGRYAGPVGWIDEKGEGEFAIALRCGRLDGRRITLYSGAGLVKGSDIDQEFEETEIKLVPMLRALGLS